jgi:hypothetical protein
MLLWRASGCLLDGVSGMQDRVATDRIYRFIFLVFFPSFFFLPTDPLITTQQNRRQPEINEGHGK